MIELFGWIGGILLAICGAPQSYKSVRDGNSDGLSHLMLWAWYMSEVLTFIYIISFADASWPLIFNYAFNIVFVSIMLKYKYFPRRPSKDTI